MPPDDVIHFTDNGRIRTLWFGNTKQSAIDMTDPDAFPLVYPRTMLSCLAAPKKLERALVIGLGGGTIPRFLREHFPGMSIDIVEINPKVIDIAVERFEARFDGGVVVHCTDARKFLRGNQYVYWDIIFLDAYATAGIPEHLTTAAFLRRLYCALDTGGVVVANLWSRLACPLYDSMIRTYLHVFPRVYVLDVCRAGNKIVLALPEDRVLDRNELIEAASTLPGDLSDEIAYGFRSPGSDGSGGKILRD